MKKILALITILACSATLYAQKYLEVYHGGEVIGSLMATDVDSIRVTGDDIASRRIHFFAAGMEKAFLISDIDSIKVNRSGDEPFVYLGVVGFNQALYDMPIDILANSTSSRYSSFVNSLMRKDGTLLYYGVEHALDLLSQYEFTTPLTSVNLITFTDGLDQGSLMMNSSYTMEPDYLNALNQRIHATTVRGLPITAYSLGLRGNDVSDYTQFRANLQQLASDESKAIEVSSMYDVQNRLQEIAEQIISISNRQTVSARIPGTSNGTRIRFTFDGNSPEYSTIFIEGTFNLADRSLRDVTYHGMRSTSGSTVRGEQDGIFVTFTFSNLYRIDGNGLIPTSYIRQYNQAPSSDTWQRNSEFTPDNNTQTTVTHSGAAIMLVLDCSNSLGSQFGNMQSYASSFISRVANNAVPFNIETPTNVSASLADDEFVVNVRWDAVKYAEFYKVYRSSSNGSFTMVADSVKATSWKDEKPLSGNNYYRIYASGHGLTSNASNTSDVVKCALDAPTNVSASLADDEFVVNVGWDAVKYAEFYKVYRSSSSNGSFTMVADSVKATSWKDEKPLSGNNYYRIYASGHGLTSSASNTSDVVKCALEAPTNVSAVKGDGQFTVNVTWDAVKYAEFYKVYRSSSSNGSFTMVADSVKATSWTDESSGYRFRYYKVRAEGHGIKSEMSSASEKVVIRNDNGIEITINGVSFFMIKVEAGTFQMGSTSGDSYENPGHQVTLTNDYYIGETEVTQELWKAVMGSNPSYFTSSDQLPVEKVSWNDCQTFITKLNELTGKNFRLPTEAEWEFAARGGNASQGYTYSGSNNIGDVAWYRDNGSSKTHEVATKAPNELGIYDMIGNVWEWCQDWYGSYSSEAQTNPTGPTSGSDRVSRGGCWLYFDYFCSVASRSLCAPGYGDSCSGLRLAL